MRTYTRSMRCAAATDATFTEPFQSSLVLELLGRLSVAEKSAPANLADYRTISDVLWRRFTGGKEGTIGRTIGRLGL